MSKTKRQNVKRHLEERIKTLEANNESLKERIEKLETGLNNELGKLERGKRIWMNRYRRVKGAEFKRQEREIESLQAEGEQKQQRIDELKKRGRDQSQEIKLLKEERDQKEQLIKELETLEEVKDQEIKSLQEERDRGKLPFLLYCGLEPEIKNSLSFLCPRQTFESLIAACSQIDNLKKTYEFVKTIARNGQVDENFDRLIQLLGIMIEICNMARKSGFLRPQSTKIGADFNTAVHEKTNNSRNSGKIIRVCVDGCMNGNLVLIKALVEVQ